MKASTSIKNFLLNSKIPDGLGYFYTPDMEVQILAAQDGGEIVTKETESGRTYRRYTDGLSTWGPLRIPRNAATEPEDNDFPLSWSIEDHAEGIGLTGWDWRAKLSRYVAFDFDNISGHATSGISEEELGEVRNRAQQIPWVSVRRSTSGKGLHLYVLLGTCTEGVWSGGIATANHTEHAALARAILGKMSAEANFDFSAKVDICGGNMWVWHRKMKGTNGLSLLKTGVPLTDIPNNWRDHLPVITNKRKKAKLSIIDDEKEDFFEEMAGSHLRIPLNDEHKKLLKELDSLNACHWWDADRHLLVAHTYDLKLAHANLKLRGIYDTMSTGKEKGTDQNCFLFPLSSGGWVVRRHSPGVQEHQYWDQDGKGWTRCYFNIPPDLRTACRAYNGMEHPKGGFIFTSQMDALAALQILNCPVDFVSEQIKDRQVKLKTNKDSRIVIEMDVSQYDNPAHFKGWIKDGKKWVRVVNSQVQAIDEREGELLVNSDSLVRHLIDTMDADAGWVIRNSNEAWQSEPLEHIKAALAAREASPEEIRAIVGTNITQAWRLVNKPFQPEYPGNREWNKFGARFRFTPSPNSDNLSFPTWQKILNHAGKGLDEAVTRSPWCIQNAVKTGADYLSLWIASIFQFPSKPLPYLFFWSKEQNTGKSTFHEALSLLMINGYADGGTAIEDPRGFNEEIASAVVCYIEEKNIAESKVAYNRIKNWVTAPMLPIHPKGGTPYLAQNCTHWIHCANYSEACPIFPGDTRITMIHVEPLDLLDLIPKFELKDRLEREASDFMRYILSVELPNSNDRLNLPTLTTDEKSTLQNRNRTDLEKFIDDNCFLVQGHYVSFAELYARFIESLGSDDRTRAYWTKIRVSKELPLQCPSGKLSSSPNVHIGNIAWRVDSDGKELPPPTPGRKYFLQDGKLVHYDA